MLNSIIMATAANVELEAEPIPEDWILDGEPQARAKKMSMSRDWTSSIVVWDCTAGTFHWHYDQDESGHRDFGHGRIAWNEWQQRRKNAHDWSRRPGFLSRWNYRKVAGGPIHPQNRGSSRTGMAAHWDGIESLEQGTTHRRPQG